MNRNFDAQSIKIAVRLFPKCNRIGMDITIYLD